jgi:hypothetical protein
VDLSVNVEYSLALAAIFFFFVSRKLTLLSLAYKQEKRREEKKSRAERHSFFLPVSHTRGHCLSGTLLFSEILYIPTFNTVAAVQCSSFGCVQWSVTRQRERNNLQTDETSCLLFLSIP